MRGGEVSVSVRGGERGKEGEKVGERVERGREREVVPPPGFEPGLRA